MTTLYEDRQIIAIGGGDAEKFLGDLVTNTLGNGLSYGALLSPQGKFLFDFFVLRHAQGFWIDIASQMAQRFAQRLMMYRLRADVTIDAVDQKPSFGLGTVPDGAFIDPRSPEMGWRGYDGQSGQDGIDWDALRVKNLIPQSGIELRENESFILEMGFERLNGVDFKKGCYVGQEVTARMKHKTELRKGLGRVAVSGSVPIGSEITRNGKTVGQVFTQSGGHALAYLRFDRVGDGMAVGEIQVTPDP